jgi:hypothetical protein
MTNGTEFDESNGLPSDNVADEPRARRGADVLPLKAGDWNNVQVSLAGDEAVLNELLVSEFTSDHPLLLPAPNDVRPALEHEPPPGDTEADSPSDISHSDS